MKSLTLFNQPIRVGEDGMICLTDMWKASGKSDAESPYHYLRNKQTKEFLAELEKNHESVVFTCVVIPYVLKVRKNGKINELGPNLKFEVCLLFSGLCAERNFTLCHEINELPTRMQICTLLRL